MAISVSASTTLPSLNRQSSSTRLSASYYSSKLSFSSSLQFLPIRWRSVSSSPVSSRYRSLVVEAKKQTFNSFDDLLANSDKPVLVDFYATWCGPCQFMVPILEQVSATLNDKIQVVKIDTEKYPKIADKYNIQALPTFILFKDGKPFDRFVTYRCGFSGLALAAVAGEGSGFQALRYCGTAALILAELSGNLAARICSEVKTPKKRNSAEILLQRVPRAHEQDLKKAIGDVMEVKGVCRIQNLHAWNFTNTDVVGTIHLHVSAEMDKAATKAQVSDILHDAGINDLTLQVECVEH
ncbi:Cation efflux protein [Corchorus capsularis]|uniref:Cation efflux protein n=1 Tax=Corchorus capsularis TaxID=210143 RepID=A0A1R3G9Z4_COCAP|nr:Cation efflux protein [Corchorus capsularis]